MANTRARAKQVTYLSDGTGGVVRNLHDKLSEYISVKDFGALGNGVNDDTAAVQAALDYAYSFGFGYTPAVYLPQGKYLVTGVVVPSYVTMFGDGDMSILALPADVAAGTYSIVSITQDSASSIVLRDFSIWGDNNNQANNPTVYGLDINTDAGPVIYSQFEGLYIKECSTYAMYIRDAGGGLDNSFFNRCMFRDSKGGADILITGGDRIDFNQCRIRSSKLPGAGHGVLLDNLGSIRIRFMNCRFDDNLGWGVYATNTSNQLTIDGCEFISNDGGGIYLDRTTNSKITNNTVFDNGNATAQIQIEFSDGTNVSNNSINGGGDYGIYLKNSDNCIVNSNLIGGGINLPAAIYLDTSDDNLINGNHVFDKQGHGIFINNSQRNTVSCNRIHDVGLATNNAYAGIVIDNNSDYSLVQNNHIVSVAANVAAHGVLIGNVNADFNYVQNNVTYGLGTASVTDTGTNTVLTNNLP